MLFNFTISSVVLFLVGFFALILSSVVWTRRKSPGAVPFLIFLLAIIWWLFARILQSAAVNFDDKVIMAIVTYFGIAVAAIFWTCFAMEYSGRNWWKRPQYLPLFFVIPVLAILFVVFSLYFNLGWFNISLLTDQDGSFVVWAHSSIFWIQITYLTLLVLWGILILGRYMLQRSDFYRRQFFIILIGTLIPGISILCYTLRYLPTGPIDWLPLSFVLGGLIYAVTIFRFKFLDVVTVARGELVERLPDGILVLNSEGRVADLNPAAEKILGTSKLAVLGKWLDRVWPDLDPLATNPQIGQHTELVREDNGKLQYLDISLTAVKGAKGKAQGHLLVIRDITERRKMEQALMESESRYETLIEQSNEGVLIIQDGVYKFANRTMTEITGYSVKELVGKLIPFTIAEDDQKILQERYSLRVSEQALPTVYDIGLIRKDGEKRDSEISIGTIVYEAYLAEMLTVRDVTERKVTQRKLEELLNEEKRLSTSLQEEIEKRRKYTRALVHELKTPLTAILASGELLEDEVKDSILMALVKNIRQSSLNM
jgi:PAS domain S-box-containing protein